NGRGAPVGVGRHREQGVRGFGGSRPTSSAMGEGYWRGSIGIAGNGRGAPAEVDRHRGQWTRGSRGGRSASRAIGESLAPSRARLAANTAGPTVDALMRRPSRLLALVGLTSLIVTPLPVAAAPAADTDTDSDSGDAEPPLDTDSDTDENEPPLDTDGDTDEDEPPLDTDADTDTADPLLPELVDQVDTDASDRIADGDDPLRDSPEAKTARRWLGAGITATVAGGVLVGGAIALGLTDPCEPAAGNSCFSDSRNRAAVTMGVPGRSE